MTPFERGRAAGRDGEQIQACPYAIGSVFARHWANGFYQGCADRADGLVPQAAFDEFDDVLLRALDRGERPTWGL